MQGLTEMEKDMVRRLDWHAMMDYGASFFCLEKLARTKGFRIPNWSPPSAASRSGVSQDPPGSGSAMKLKTLMGDHAVTQAFKRNTSLFDFADVKAPATAFKRVVRALEFDVAELAIVTFLLAKAHGKPLKLLPAVVMARFQHPYLVYNAERGPLSPKDLSGKRVGLRSYSVTTSAWIRGILADDFGVDLDRIKWMTFEEPHVAEFRDPPNVERAPAGRRCSPCCGPASSTPRSSARSRRTQDSSRSLPTPSGGEGLAQEARRDPDQPHGGGKKGRGKCR